MRAGDLDRRVIIQRDDGTATDGKHVAAWGTVATVWAQKLDVAGREAFAAGIDQVELADARFKIRWRSGITPANRLLFDGVPYDIVHVGELGRREGLELWCKRRSTDSV